MNAYNNLTMLKSRLDITGTGNDTDLLALLVAASRQMDKLTNRFFYVDATTRYFDGAGIVIFPDDLLAVTTLKTDEDGDATFEVTMATTDYVLYPLNKFPKVYAKISSDSDYGGFANGVRKGVEIAGNFGFGNGRSATPYSTSGDSVQDAAGMTATQTTITVTSGANFAAGQTLQIESEQVYVKSISANVLTVQRAVNGTTGATHANATVIYIYDYPEPIMEAVLILAMRWWKRRETAFQDMAGLPELGTTVQYKALDPDVKLIAFDYHKRNG